MMPVVTFLSDFGFKDAYGAQVKAVILSGVPDARIIDITHDIAPFNIISAGWLLATSFRFFPPGTVHLVVVDPGVGTGQAILTVRKEDQVFVGPDNGVFSFLYPADEVREVTWRPQGAVSSTFHGRDIFAPLVVKILAGHGLPVPGMPKPDPVVLDIKSPMVVHIDTFGNVITTIGCDHLREGCVIGISGKDIDLVAHSFAEIPEGMLGLICGSASTIEIVANRGNAAQILGVKVGMRVYLKEGTAAAGPSA
jgi:S-adenosylmethionine hydrolase